MPSPISGTAHDLLMSKTDFVIGDFPSADRFIGGDGVVRTVITDCPLIQCRGYRQVQVWSFVPGLSGGTSPYIQWSVELNVSGTQSQSMLANAINTGASGNTGSSATVAIFMGIPGTGWTSLTGGVAVATTTVGTPLVAPYIRLKYWTSGGPTSLTSGGVWVYGIR